MERPSYIDVNQEAAVEYFRQPIPGEIVMLNLLKFRDEADYSEAAHLAPAETISGKEAYRLYMQHTLPFLQEAGSEVLFYGKGGNFLIGPQEEDWDEILLVKHQSRAKFMAFASHEGYLKIAGHRKAALADSRLLPIERSK